MQEIHLMHKLSYDRNMVQFYGACLDATCPMLVLEYMEGGDLQSCILQDCYPHSIGQFRWYHKGGRVALDVAKGLVFLHEQKVRLLERTEKKVSTPLGAMMGASLPRSSPGLRLLYIWCSSVSMSDACLLGCFWH